MEKEIEIPTGTTLESAVYTLLAAKSNGEHAFCIFNGVKLHSDTVSIESAYQDVLGKSKEEYQKEVDKWSKDFDELEAESKETEGNIQKALQESRANGVKLITPEIVIKGLKYVAEHRDQEQEEFAKGLIEIGCNFTLKDVREQFDTSVNIFEGMKKGDIGCGASVVANARDKVFNRAYCEENFLAEDNDTSVYHFIRAITGDETYTIDNIAKTGTTK